MNGPFGRAVESVERATRALIEAARQGAESAIEAAVRDRARAVEELRSAWTGSDVTESDRQRARERISLQVDDAGNELTDLQLRVRDELRSIYGGVRAARGYAAKSRESSGALDRAG